MRPAAEVHERVRVPVRGDDALSRALGRVDALDDLALVGLIGEDRQTLLDRVLFAHEGLVLGHHLAHARLDATQVLFAEMGATGQLEVVVEAVLDRRSDGETGAGPQLQHGLGHHVRGGVTEHGAPGSGVLRHDRDPRSFGQWGAQIHLPSVERRRYRGPGQTGSDALGQVGGGRPTRQRPLRAVR